MDSKSIVSLTEAYSAVYSEELRNELEEMNDEFFGIEELTEEQIESIVEETIDEMIGEGYDFDDVEEIFDEIISEATVTTGRGGYTKLSSDKKSTAVTTGSGSKIAAASRLSAAKAAKREAKVAQVKAAVKQKVAQVKAAPGVAAKAAQKKVKDIKQQSHVGAAKYASNRGLMKGAGLKTQSSKGRSEIRSAVAKDIKSRIGKKISGAVQKAKTFGSGVASAAASAPGAVRQAGSNVKAKAKKGIRGALLGAARKLKEDEEIKTVDVYDIVLEHLIENGYAETLESAEVIMVNMSEEWREKILEGIFTSNV